MTSSKFLKVVLGEEGSKALEKAAERAPVLDSVLVPRTVIAWLSSSIRLGYEGEIPGLENSYIKVTKSDVDNFSGALTVGEQVYPFESAELLHIAAAVGVALGIHGQKMDPALKSYDLSKLGKSIDLLVNARLIARSLANGDMVQKAISDIAAGKMTFQSPKGDKTYDYSHVLPPEHRAAGYSMSIMHSRYDGLMAQLHHNKEHVGTTGGSVENGKLGIDIADLYGNQHIGKGMGSAMYEALMAHAKHHLGATHIGGGIHSTMASKVHERLSAKHGMTYKAPPTPAPQLAAPVPGPHDARFGPYEYALKQELPTTKSEGTLRREVRVSKAETLKKCGECGGIQFNSHKFVGCICFRSLSKSVRTDAHPDGSYTLRLAGSDWDEDSITTLITVLKG